MMKKIAVFLLALVLLLSLTGCEDAISKLLYKSDKDDPDLVQAREPDIPDTPPAVDNTPPVDQTEPDGPAEPEVPDDAPAPDEEKEPNAAAIAASHTDVSLFYAGESFKFLPRGVSGTYACTYTSANTEIAAVDESTGTITAVSPGMTTVSMHLECSEGQYDFDCIVRCRWEPALPEGEPDAGGPEQTGGGAPPAQDAAPSLSGFFSTLQGRYEGLDRLMVLDAQLLDSYYPGLRTANAVEEVLVQESAMTISNVAVGLVKLSENAATEDILAVQSILQSRITAQAEGGAFYPSACETWENGVITSASNCVGMFVYPDGAHDMASLFAETFGG